MLYSCPPERKDCRGFNEAMKKMTHEEVQAVAFDILKAVAAFCEKEGLRYTLSSGSMIGAVRHKGFIPWDDDIDLEMPYPDYLEFIRRFDRAGMPDCYELRLGMKGKKGLTFVQVADTRTVTISPYRDKHRYLSVWVDIQPVYACSDNPEEAYAHAKLLFDLVQKSRRYLKLPRKRYHPFKWLYRKLTSDFWIGHHLRRINRELERHPYGSTGSVRPFWVQREPKRVSLPLSLYEEYAKCSFEGHEFMILKDYDFYLRTLYGGNYMQLPPESERVVHEVSAYWLEEGDNPYV